MTDQYPFPLTGTVEKDGTLTLTVPAEHVGAMMSVFSGTYTVILTREAPDGSGPVVLIEHEDLAWFEATAEASGYARLYPGVTISVFSQETGRHVARYLPAKSWY